MRYELFYLGGFIFFVIGGLYHIIRGIQLKRQTEEIKDFNQCNSFLIYKTTMEG